LTSTSSAHASPAHGLISSGAPVDGAAEPQPVGG